LVEKPYADTWLDEITFLRNFKYADKEKFIWHQDLHDRIIRVVHANKCFFQFDNQTPFQIKDGDIIEVPKNQIHRLILVKGCLLLKISEIRDYETEIREKF
tara:strand:- start:46 stop:348 length:303 start_codon:yes stop_codon:yes gene_type:complete